MHEASLYDDNCYITLTYDSSNLPAGGSLEHGDFQKFLKRLRKAIAPQRVRYYMCGEYGEVCAECERSEVKCVCKSFRPTLGRPHYHALLFGYDFPDKYLWKHIKGNPAYRSPVLEKLWREGISTIGGVTVESASYVARYILKKQKGKDSRAHYLHLDKTTGEVYERVPEYTRMSLRSSDGSGRGGIGAEWLKTFAGDVFPYDECIIDGRRYRLPRYYDEILKSEDESLYASIKSARVLRALANSDNSRERLAARERCAQRRLEIKTRGYETDAD